MKTTPPPAPFTTKDIAKPKKVEPKTTPAPYEYSFTTKDLADVLKVKPETILRGYCVNGHYQGLKPLKMKNGRNLWPKVKPEEVAC